MRRMRNPEPSMVSSIMMTATEVPSTSERREVPMKRYKLELYICRVTKVAQKQKNLQTHYLL